MTVLAVDYMEPADTVRRTAEERGYRFPVLLDPEADSLRPYAVRFRPMSFLVDARGVVRGTWIGPSTVEDWRQALREAG